MVNGYTQSARLAAFTAALALAACSPDEILDVEDVDVALPEAVQDAAALPSVLAGAIGEFGFAYNGNAGSLNIITLAGTLSDELHNTETFPTRIQIDNRRQETTNGTLRDLFYDVHQARSMADRTAAAYEEFAPDNPGHAEALNLSALTYIFLAENYCGAVPISRETSPGVFEFGQMLTTAQLLDSAAQKASRALAIAEAAGTGSAATTQARLARVARARALLNLDQPAQAAAAIGGETGVPTTYQYLYRHSQTTGRQNNATWALTNSVGRFGVPDAKGINGLPFRSEGDRAGTIQDPRVSNIRRTSNRGLGFDNTTPQWVQLKHATRDTFAIVADGVEARLIEAEAELRAGNAGGAFTILNNLRSNTALLRLRGYVDASNQPVTFAPLVPAATAAGREDQLFKERAYWLYLSGHRLGDLRRLIKFYGRGAETVFPTGVYHKFGTYGTDVNSPVPQAEENNPEFQRAECDLTKP
jgi:starch-binding outer membrane protein, SusD/RagB family